jgi:pimeloyl-ACP methyl ester carboxylesterase
MKNLIVITAFLLAFCSFGITASFAQNSLDGYWEGVGKLPNEDLKFMITFKTEADGLKGTIDIPESATSALPLADVSINGSKVNFVMPGGAGRVPFEGEISGDTISGTSQFGKQSVPFVLKRGVKTQSFNEEEVSYQNGNIKLAATLLLPNTKSPHPVIVFQHAARPSKRDVWRFFADQFARRGIACLIYDNRGVGGSTGNSRVGFEDLASDGIAAINYLKTRKDINRKQIGLFAASQGAWVAPIVATRSRDVAFILLISAPTVTMAENHLYEMETDLRAAGFSEEEIKTAVAYRKPTMELIRVNAPDEQIEAAIQKAKNERWFPYVGVPAKDHWQRQWFPLVLGFNPAPVWEKVKSPVLNVMGELDKNVRVSQNAPIMEQALKKGGNKDFTIKIFPKANHSIMVSEQGRQRLAAGYLDFMTDWILKRVIVLN